MKSIIFYVLFVLMVLLVSSFPLEQVKQNCTVKSRSQCGTPISCDSNPPLPLSATATIQLSKKIWWNGFDSWNFAIQDAKGHLIKLEGDCMQGQSQGGEYGVGANITLHFVCNKLPRELVKGDKIWMYVFADQKNPDFWLMMNIPILGFSSQEFDEDLNEQSNMPEVRVNEKILLNRLKIWSSSIRKKIDQE